MTRDVVGFVGPVSSVEWGCECQLGRETEAVSILLSISHPPGQKLALANDLRNLSSERSLLSATDQTFARSSSLARFPFREPLTDRLKFIDDADGSTPGGVIKPVDILNTSFLTSLLLTSSSLLASFVSTSAVRHASNDRRISLRE